MEQITKIKIVLLCHLSSAEIRSYLTLRSLGFENFFRGLLNKRPTQYEDNAPWNLNILKELEKYNELEVHVVAPHPGMKKKRENFSLRGVTYHFFQCDSAFPYSYLRRRTEVKGKEPYKRNRDAISDIIHEIHPDIVNLVGAENPYYASAVLGLDGFPVMLSCQTVYSNPTRREHDKNFSQLRWDVEQEIFQKVDFFACLGPLHRDLVLEYRKDAVVFKMVFPYKPFPTLKEVEKKYDFVFFAQTVSVKKGADNAVEALALVKQRYADVSLLIVGANKDPFKTLLNNRIEELGLTENVSFHDYFPRQEDMLQYVKQARFAVLPIKMDIVSGTILQAMTMGLPVVTHITSGTPLLNKENECVLLSEINDNKQTANNMIALMDSPELAEKLRQNSLNYIKTQDDEAKMAGEKWLAQYKAVFNNYYNNEPVPEELIYKQ